MDWSMVAKDFVMGCASAIKATGANDIYERMTRTYEACPPDEADNPCNALILKRKGGIIIGAAWIDYILHWLPLISCLSRTPVAKKICSTWTVLADIWNMWNFYAYAALAFYAETWGSYIKDERATGIFIVALGLGIFSNPKLRYVLRELRGWGGLDVPRGCAMQFSDMFFEMCRGFANGRNFLAAVQMTVDLISKIGWAPSLLGLVIRYTFGGIWALINLGVTIKYIPILNPEDIFRGLGLWPTTLRVINSSMLIIILFALITLALANVEIEYQITYSFMLSLLLPAIFFRSLYKNWEGRCGAEAEQLDEKKEDEFKEFISPAPPILRFISKN